MNHTLQPANLKEIITEMFQQANSNSLETNEKIENLSKEIEDTKEKQMEII